MVAHEKRNSAQLFCAVPTQNDLALSSLLFSAHPTQKLEYPTEPLQREALSFRASPQTGAGIRPFKKEKRIAASLCAAKQVPLG